VNSAIEIHDTVRSERSPSALEPLGEFFHIAQS